VRDVDLETVLGCYEGHTFFSIFRKEVKVYEKVKAQLNEMEFDEVEDIDGTDVENNYLRRLHCALTLPVGDWQDS